MIFNFVKQFLEKHINEHLMKPIADCAICMTPWWGAVVYLLFGVGTLQAMPLVLLAAMGVNAIIVKATGLLERWADNAEEGVVELNEMTKKL